MKNSKFFVFLATLFLLFINLQDGVYAEVTKNNKNSEFKGIIKNVSLKGNNVLKDVKTVELKVTNFNIVNKNVYLAGTINNLKEEKEIELSGDLFKSKTSPDSAVGNVADLKNNFTIAYFLISQKTKKDTLKINKNFANKNVLILYLFNKDTRELIMIESPIDLSNFEGEFSNLPELDKKNEFLEHWWLKVFQPTVIEEEQEPGISTLAVTDGNKYFNTTFSFNLDFGIWVKYYVTVRLQTAIRDLGTVPDTARLEITSERTDSNQPSAITNSTPYVLKNVKVEARVQTPISSDMSKFGDRITQYQWVGNYSTGGSVSTELSTGILNVASVSWKSGSDINTSLQVPPLNTVGIKFKYPGRIDKGQYYAMTMYKEAKKSTTAPYGKQSVFYYYFDVVDVGSNQGKSNNMIYSQAAYK